MRGAGTLVSLGFLYAGMSAFAPSPRALRTAVHGSQKSRFRSDIPDLFMASEDERSEEKEDLVDKLIREAQAEARLGVSLEGEDPMENYKRMTGALFDEGEKQLQETAREIREEISRGKEEWDEASESAARSAAIDLEAKIKALTADFEASTASSKEALARENQVASAGESTGDAAVDAALARAEARSRQGAAPGKKKPSTTCVVLTPAGDSPGPLAAKLEAALAQAGWTVLAGAARGLDTASGPPPAGAPLPGLLDPELVEACAAGASVVVCPEAAGGPESVGGAKAKGGFLGGLLGGGKAGPDFLTTVEPKAMAALLKAMPGAGHVVLLSCAGVERTNKQPYSMANFGGGLDKRRAAEQALQLYSKQTGLDYTLVRVASLDEGAAPSGTPLKAAFGDCLDGACAPAALADALLRVLASGPAGGPADGLITGGSTFLRNASVALEGGAAVPTSPAGWEELFLAVDGPELFRSEELPTQSGLKATSAWVESWCQRWTEKGSGLTTKVVAKATGPEGRFGLFFNPSTKGPKSRVGNEGGIEIIVDQARDRPEAGFRIRARRFAYGEGAVIKEMSEEVILRRLKDDVARLLRDLVN